MNRLKILIPAAFLVLSSCKDSSHPLTPVEPPVSSPGEITYEQIDYDLYSVRHSSGSRFTSDQIVAIVVGELDSTGFRVRDSLAAVWNPQSQLYQTDFYAILPFDISQTRLTARVRYYRASGGWIDIDSTLSTMRYPYPGTELILSTPRTYFVEDLDISDSVIYGQINNFILMHDLKTGLTSQILVGSYEVLTVVNNRFIFFDHANWSLYRHDLLFDTTQQFVHHREGRFMMGLEYYDGALYELLLEASVISLLKYNLSGQLLDSIHINRNVSRLTISNGIAYFHGWSEPRTIHRFDLSTKTFIDVFKAPAHNHEGIRLRDGYIYYSDFDKRAIARFPLSELFAHGRISSPASSQSQPDLRENAHLRRSEE